MNLREKEQFLHKTIAASAFVCALCILPVAQYLLGEGSLVSQQGDVAGASTDTSITQASIAKFGPECEDQKATDLADLDKYLTGTRIAFENEFGKRAKPYQEAITVLTGTTESIATDTAALAELVEVERQAYLSKLSSLESAVSSQKNDIEARSCVAE